MLFEAATELGGQVVLAAKATWRRDMAGITPGLPVKWIDWGWTSGSTPMPSRRRPPAVPDVVIIATGGVPNVGTMDGSDRVVSTWDVLSGSSALGDDIVLFDESGAHSGLSCAEFAASQGSNVLFVTPERSLGRELGGTNLGAHMNELYRYGVRIRPDCRVVSVTASGNRLVATVENIYNNVSEEIEIDQVIGDVGTLPNDDLYYALKPGSRNLGEVDLSAMARFEPPAVLNNPDAAFDLFRLGDAWTSRNIHAAMLDAMRICKDL